MYYHFTHLHHKRQSYDVWFLRYWSQQTDFFVIFNHFLSFYPHNNPKIKISKKWNKKPGDIIILHMCTINENHMMHSSWDMEHDKQNFLSFWTTFCPFTSLKTLKIKILKIWKNTWRYHHFTLVHQKSWSYVLLFLRYGTWQM